VAREIRKTSATERVRQRVPGPGRINTFYPNLFLSTRVLSGPQSEHGSHKNDGRKSRRHNTNRDQLHSGRLVVFLYNAFFHQEARRCPCSVSLLRTDVGDAKHGSCVCFSGVLRAPMAVFARWCHGAGSAPPSLRSALASIRMMKAENPETTSQNDNTAQRVREALVIRTEIADVKSETCGADDPQKHKPHSPPMTPNETLARRAMAA